MVDVKERKNYVYYTHSNQKKDVKYYTKIFENLLKEDRKWDHSTVVSVCYLMPDMDDFLQKAIQPQNKLEKSEIEEYLKLIKLSIRSVKECTKLQISEEREEVLKVCEEDLKRYRKSFEEISTNVMAESRNYCLLSSGSAVARVPSMPPRSYGAAGIPYRSNTFAEGETLKVAMASSSRNQYAARIPTNIQDPSLTLSAFSTVLGSIPTIFVGIVNSRYTDEMWNDHKAQIVQLFGIIEPNSTYDIRIQGSDTQVDADNLRRDIAIAANVVNANPISALRIVGLGIGTAINVTQALEALIRGWQKPPAEKEVQFVALVDGHYLQFCKSLCLKQVCKSIQYYCTQDYDEDGRLDLDRPNPIYQALELLKSQLMK